MARKIFHGRAGQLYQRYQDGMEDQIGALGLVLNAVVLTCWAAIPSSFPTCPAACGPCATSTPPTTADRGRRRGRSQRAFPDPDSLTSTDAIVNRT
ncbi:transposase [Streptomyces sp. LP05-1]|uniref:Transposase n=1 Tax=Streptomyces pyxinae TaxID=2970734 RepID=A0ABT2CF39_9ACTN|nr:transposase [Streptomyces sp. LP05-1]MCS0635991.1 transposase [Streptomyces sp. LP05-1]